MRGVSKGVTAPALAPAPAMQFNEYSLWLRAVVGLKIPKAAVDSFLNSVLGAVAVPAAPATSSAPGVQGTAVKGAEKSAGVLLAVSASPE